MLNNVKTPKKLQGGVEQTKFYILARDFANGLRKGQTKNLESIASQGIRAFKSLPSDQRRNADTLALVLQMRSLGDKQPEKVIEAIDKMESKLKLSITAREALLWARIKCFERLGRDEELVAYLANVAKSSPEAWQMEQIYPAVRSLPDPGRRLDVVRSMIPGLGKLPSMDRRFRVMEIDAQLELGQYEEAYDQAKAFLDAYPRAGDGWRVLAIAAANTDKPFEADRAWKTITERSDPRRDIWWEGMISRAEIRANSTRPKAACEILDEIRARKTQMPATLSDRVSKLNNDIGTQVGCASANTG